jgi:hypothetical protein
MFDSREQDEALLELLTALNDAMFQFKRYNALRDSVTKEYERTLLKCTEHRVFKLHETYRSRYEVVEQRRLVGIH